MHGQADLLEIVPALCLGGGSLHPRDGGQHQATRDHEDQDDDKHGDKASHGDPSEMVSGDADGTRNRPRIESDASRLGCQIDLLGWYDEANAWLLTSGRTLPFRLDNVLPGESAKIQAPPWILSKPCYLKAERTAWRDKRSQVEGGKC